MSKEVILKEHGTFIYGTLDGVDFVGSGVIRDTGRPYSASVKLKFIMRATKYKEINGVSIPTVVANSQIIKIECKDDELPQLALKYNELINKDLLINYNGKDGDTFVIQNEKDIVSVK